MFIRKRTKKLKNGETAIYFQAVHSYRRNGKVVQKVVALGKNPNITAVLNDELRFLQKTKKELEIPLSEYKEARWKNGWGMVVHSLPIKVAEKRREKLLERRRKQLNRISKLDSLASRRK
jgi:hypothetical protein